MLIDPPTSGCVVSGVCAGIMACPDGSRGAVGPWPNTYGGGSPAVPLTGNVPVDDQADMAVECARDER